MKLVCCTWRGDTPSGYEPEKQAGVPEIALRVRCVRPVRLTCTMSFTFWRQDRQVRRTDATLGGGRCCRTLPIISSNKSAQSEVEGTGDEDRDLRGMPFSAPAVWQADPGRFASRNSESLLVWCRAAAGMAQTEVLPQCNSNYIALGKPPCATRRIKAFGNIPFALRDEIPAHDIQASSCC